MPQDIYAKPMRSSTPGTAVRGLLLAMQHRQAARDPEKRRLSKRDLLNLISMLLMLLKNGLSLQKSLEALAADRTCRRYRDILIALRMKVSAGNTLSQALASFPKAFNSAMVHHVALAESSGRLLVSLQRISEHLEAAIELRRKLIQKLSYPCLVTVAGIGLVAFMLAVVVPQFESIYSENQVALPWVTRFVSGLSRILASNLWFLPLGSAGVYIIYRSIMANAHSSLALDRWLLQTPWIGRVLQDINALEYFRSALMLCEAGFVPQEALAQATRSVPNRYARHLLVQSAQEIRQGKRISQALEPCHFMFPNSALQLITIGEQTGSLTTACQGAVELINRRIQSRLSMALGIMEPALTIGLAVCIGWIVLAIYMPMFHMFDVLDF